MSGAFSIFHNFSEAGVTQKQSIEVAVNLHEFEKPTKPIGTEPAGVRCVSEEKIGTYLHQGKKFKN